MSQSKEKGFCRHVMRKCTGIPPPHSKNKNKHIPAYNCPLCHICTKKDGPLISFPHYKQHTEIGCNHRSNKKSSARHGKKYHGTTTNHKRHWVQDNPHSSMRNKNNNVNKPTKGKKKSVTFSLKVSTRRSEINYHPKPINPSQKYYSRKPIQEKKKFEPLHESHLQQRIIQKRNESKMSVPAIFEKYKNWGVYDDTLYGNTVYNVCPRDESDDESDDDNQSNGKKRKFSDDVSDLSDPSRKKQKLNNNNDNQKRAKRLSITPITDFISKMKINQNKSILSNDNNNTHINKSQSNTNATNINKSQSIESNNNNIIINKSQTNDYGVDLTHYNGDINVYFQRKKQIEQMHKAGGDPYGISVERLAHYNNKKEANKLNNTSNINNNINNNIEMIDNEIEDMCNSSEDDDLDTNNNILNNNIDINNNIEPASANEDDDMELPSTNRGVKIGRLDSNGSINVSYSNHSNSNDNYVLHDEVDEQYEIKEEESPTADSFPPSTDTNPLVSLSNRFTTFCDTLHNESDPNKSLQLLESIVEDMKDVNIQRLDDEQYESYISLYAQIRQQQVQLEIQKFKHLKNEITNGFNRLHHSKNKHMKALQKQVKNIIIDQCCQDEMVITIHADGTKTYDPESEKYNKQVAESCGISDPSSASTLDNWLASESSNNNHNKNNKTKQPPAPPPPRKHRTHYKDPVELHVTHSIWSALYHESNNYGLGCHACFNNPNDTKSTYGAQQFPYRFTLQDMIENKAPWQKALKEHNRHHKNGQHIKSMDFQLNCDYFNDRGIMGQLTVSFFMFRTNTSENLYGSILFCCHNTGGFVGNTGHTYHQLGYYMDITYNQLLINVKKHLRVPRPWAPNKQPPMYSTQDIWSQKSCSLELHMVIQMLSIKQRLTWVSVPVGLDKITGEDGQTKKLLDCAARHIKWLKNIYCDPIEEDSQDTKSNDEEDTKSNDEKESKSNNNNNININDVGKLIELFEEFWVRHTGDGPYSKGGRIKARFVKVAKDKYDIDLKEWKYFDSWWCDMHRWAIGIKNAMESDGGTFRTAFVCIFKLIALRLKSPTNQDEIKRLARDIDGIMRIVNQQGYNTTRMSGYERKVYKSWIIAMKYILLWAQGYSELMFNYVSSMSFQFSVYASCDIYVQLGAGCDIVQTVHTFPHMKLKNLFWIRKNTKCMMNDLKKSFNTLDHKLDEELWPYLSKNEEYLKTFVLHGINLNDKEFINDNGDIDLHSFGDLTTCINKLRTEILQSICRIGEEEEDIGGQNCLQNYCCDEPYDTEKLYITCGSKHPLCKVKIHKSCSGLTTNKYNKSVYSKKAWICNACKTLGVKKPLTKKQIESELKKSSNPNVQLNISNTNANNNNNKNNTNNKNNKNNKNDENCCSDNKLKPTIKNGALITEFMGYKHPEPAQSRIKGLHLTNPSYDAARKRKVWKNCCRGILDFIEALQHHLWSQTPDGLFSELYYKDSIVFMSMKILDFDDWVKIRKNKTLIEKLLKKKKYAINTIKRKLISIGNVTKVLKYIKDNQMKSLECLYKISVNKFVDKLSLFIFDYLIEYCEDTKLHHTILIHKVLFNGKDNGIYNEIKSYVDCVWHIGGSENMAETGLKTIGNILKPSHMSLGFEKLMKKGMIQMLLPCLAEEDDLKKDCLVVAKCDGIRSMKTDSRSYNGSIKFRNMIQKNTGRVPYGIKSNK